MAFYHSLQADIRRERPVDEIFAKSSHIDWLKPGVESKDLLCAQHGCADQNKSAVALPFVPPEAWKGFPGQPIIGGRPPTQQKAPWLYGEAPDLQRLIGNATPGYGS